MKKKQTATEIYDAIVIGGGAAGMMAAGRAAELGFRVLLLEKNKTLGVKLNLTGGGRCNITNAIFNTRDFLSVYGDAKEFLFSAFSQFGVQDTFDFFKRLGLPLVVEARTRAFPNTQKAADVTKALERYMRKHGVIIRLNRGVNKVLMKDKLVQAVSGKEVYFAKNLILATGGLSHPETGSTGDGFKWLSGLGHTVRESSPDIVPLEVKESWVKKLAGVSLSFMKITFFVDGQKVFSKKGKILFTHFGLSGPLILNSARRVKEMFERGIVTVEIDAFPDTDLGSLEKYILKIFEKNKNKFVRNAFLDIAPAGAAEAIFPLLGLDKNLKVHDATKEKRKQIARLLKAWPATVSRLMGFDRAVVSDGGVCLAEIDTRSMRSKIQPNLFILGDLLDINRQSGGYSLQLCWTTGFVAASHLTI